MPDETLPTVTESALRGIACRCPRCGKGKLYAGFLDLRPSCEACGLDYAFIDAGDGPAIFIIMIAGAIVVACALIVKIKYQPPFWLHAALWLPLIARHHAVAAALDEVAFDRAAVSSQGGARPADRSRAEMTGNGFAPAPRRRLRAFSRLLMVAVLRRPRDLAIAAPGREARADRGTERAPGGAARRAAAAARNGVR